MNNYYNPKFIETLFDKMSSSYSKMNYISSFGFSERWRRQCVKEINLEQAEIVLDLMTGMGECWKYISKETNKNSKLIGLDFSSEMIKRAKVNKSNFHNREIELLQENVFENSIKDQSIDCIISGFGLKTFNENQLNKLAIEIERILKGNGQFSLIDVSIPPNRILKVFYMFYLKNIIPLLGKVFMGNPETYKMLGFYTQKFNNSKEVKHIFEKYNFQVEYVEYFYGCATGIKGIKNDNLQRNS